ncbi:hypothetical protein E3N88_11668 [Mikania micrantha]|uniref:Uncharacterized protein n=1 Tax=Mikania micrantha TaxID=192012 RepID=A0A5N6P3H0_9ASTR|nr:hypothetical protein E3N88_11668 [Mikania micrantha]
MSHENNSSFALKSILEKDKLNNTNFLEWHRNLKIVLKFAKKHYVLEGPVPNEPECNTATARKAWEKHNEDAIEVACLMQATMSSDLQKNMEDMGAFDMIQQLTGMFQKQARQERYDTMKQLIACKMQEGSSVSAHVLTMKGYIDQLNKLGYPLLSHPQFPTCGVCPRGCDVSRITAQAPLTSWFVGFNGCKMRTIECELLYGLQASTSNFQASQMLNNGGFSGLCKEEDENRRRVACLVEQNDENRCDDDLGSLKRKICDFRCQAYRLTWAVSSCRYARIRSDEALNFLPRASPDVGVSGQAYRLACFSSPISLFLLFWPDLARFSIIGRRSSVVWTLLINY